MNKIFSAPWGILLKITTAFSVLLLLGVTLIGLLTGPREETVGNIWYLSMVGLPLCILIASVFFMVRGYVLSRESILIKRFGWDSQLELKGLLSVEYDPAATKGSIRTFGNGGMFAFSGKFWNRKLGLYSAYITDFRLSVVLYFDDHVIVISPENPQLFIAELKLLRGM